MTVTYEPPRLNEIRSLHALALTHEVKPNADVGVFQARPADPFCAAS